MTTTGSMPVLSVAILGAAALTILAAYWDQRWLTYLCKPFTTGLILLMGSLRGLDGDRRYSALLIVGLLASLAGDIFLMLPNDRFLPGLTAFLLAHLAYALAFTIAAPVMLTTRSLLTLAPFLLFAALIFQRLAPRVGRLRVPVMLYILAIVGMAWRATERWLDDGTTAALIAMLGAILFVLSDTLLAWNRFVRQFHAAQLLILGTYFAAQWLIALSM